MPTFEVSSPEGKKYRVTTPDGATQDDAISYVKEKFGGMSAEPQKRGAVDQLLGIGGERYQTWPERLVRDIGSTVAQGAETFRKGASGELGLPGTREFTEAAVPGMTQAATLGITGAPGTVAALANPVRKLGADLARTYPEKIEDQAINKIEARFAQGQKAGGPSAQEALEQVNVANAAGKPMTLADVGSKPVKSLGGNVYRAGGEGGAYIDRFLQQRDKESFQRLSQDVSQYVHGGPSMHKTAEALLDARATEGKPLWDEVRQMQGVWSPRLQEFIDDSVIRKGMARGYEIERLESLAEGREFNPTQLGVDLDAEGNIKMIAAPNMRVLHMAKMGLDAMIADERNEITGRLSTRGVALERVRQAYLKEIDALDTSGIYRQARGAWEGRSKSLDAVRAGRSVFKSSPEETAAEFAKLNPGDQEFFRVGVADMLRERLMKTGISGDEAKSIIKTPWVQEQLRPVFRTPQEFDSFVESVTREMEMFATNFETRRGSQTAERMAEDAGQDHTMALGGAEIARHLGTGEWFSAIRKFMQMKRDLGLRQNPKLNQKIAETLFSKDPNLGPSVGYSRNAATKTPATSLGAADPSFEQFLEKGKPLLLTNAAELDAYGLTEAVRAKAGNRITSIKDPGTGHERIIAWQPGREKEARELLDIYRNSKGPLTAEQHRHIGKLLGYPEKEIDAFVKDRFGGVGGKTNYLERPAQALEKATPALAPGAASALAGSAQ